VVPNLQQGLVMTGSATVTAGGKQLATSMSQVVMCAQVPGTPVPTVADVTVD
jgi:hypothetical protein